MNESAESKPLASGAKSKAPNKSQQQSKTNFIFLGSHCKQWMGLLAIFRMLITAVVLFGDFCLQGGMYEVGFYSIFNKISGSDDDWRQRQEEKQRYFTFLFHLGLAYSACNVFISSLLWAGTFAKKKHCLPIYAMAEILFTFCWIQPFFFIDGGESSHEKEHTEHMTLIGVAVLLGTLVFLIFVIRKVLSPLYIYLGIIEKKAKDEELDRLQKLFFSEGRHSEETEMA